MHVRACGRGVKEMYGGVAWRGAGAFLPLHTLVVMVASLACDEAGSLVRGGSGTIESLVMRRSTCLRLMTAATVRAAIPTTPRTTATGMTHAVLESEELPVDVRAAGGGAGATVGADVSQ